MLIGKKLCRFQNFFQNCFLTQTFYMMNISMKEIFIFELRFKNEMDDMIFAVCKGN